ncbi:S14_ClpP_1 domain containing protein [uncultured Caudovirales phage]|uniref:S14_ClpP_1 domain containing protein n=1 Tax=uncultured Caudovirales phage TaxID=2100421 RepID=A0A6J5N1A1_9CAUD|nr:S14_ClpP_1 domain containing protein [uncultured Caudovirales phage]
MNKVAHFYAYGIIANEQAEFAKEYGIVAAKQVADFIVSNSDAEEFVIHIHSQGGDVDEGFAIHDLLTNSGKKVTTIIEGLCASIATVIALAGNEKQITENATFFIHNAWGGANGDAEELQKYTDNVKAATEKIIDFYVSKTSGDRAVIAQLMNSDTSLTAIQAKELGFVDTIKTPIAASILTIKKFTNQSNDHKLYNEMKQEIKNQFDSIKKFLKINAEQNGVDVNNTTSSEPIVALALEVETDKGVLHIEEPTVANMISVGDVCTIDGAVAPEGEYTSMDGTVYAIDATGVVTAITVLTEEPSDLVTENQILKEEIVALKAASASLEASIASELKAIKASLGSTYRAPLEKKAFNKGIAASETEKEKLEARKATYKQKK